MKTLEFKSQICTTKEQSERLLALGLKPNTADCMYSVMTKEYNGRYILEEDRHYNLCLFRQEDFQSVGFSHYEHIPAWSLSRLIELINLKIQFRIKECTTVIYGISHSQPFQSFSGIGIDGKSYYNSIINAIEWLIKEGYFNKKYLEEI